MEMMNYQEEDSSDHDMPVGFIFKPTDTELLSILKARILDPTSGGGFVPECNGLYEEEPWRIFGEPDAANYNCRFQEKKKKMENHFYVFTTLKKMGNKSSSSSSSRFYRRVGHGGGTWKGNNVKDVKNDRGVVIGTVRNFTFVPTGKKAAAASSSWIMDEFSIPEMSRDYVVCKIKLVTTATTGDTGENLIITSGSHGDHMISSCIPSSSSSSSSSSSFHMLMNGAKLGHETNVDAVDYDHHSSWAGVSNSMISLMAPPNSTVLPAAAATLYFNDEPPSCCLPPQQQQGQHDDAHNLFQVAEGDNVVYDEHMMSLLQPPPLEYYCSSSTTPPQQQAAAARAPSSPLDQTLLLGFPSTQQLQVTHSNLFRGDNAPTAAADMMRGNDDDDQYCLQQPLMEPSNFQQPHVDDHHDKNNRSSCLWEVLEAFVNSTDQDHNHVNNPDLVYACRTFTDSVSSPTPLLHGVNFDDLWTI